MAERNPDSSNSSGESAAKELDEDQQTDDPIEDEYSDLQRLLADAVTFKAPVEDLELIIKSGGKVNDPVKRGLRPIHYASYVNYTEGVQLLIDNSCDVNIYDDIGYTALHLCARRGNYDTMTMLIANGAHVNYCDAGSEVQEKLRNLGYLSIEPLNLAIENNHIECARLLLEKGAKADHQYFMGSEINLIPLENLECLELLLQYGADPNSFNRCGQTALMKACREHHIPAVRMLLQHGADVNLQSPPKFDTKTAIHYAIQVGNLVITEILLQNGARTNKLEGFKYTPLHYAVLRDRADICELLLKHGAIADEQADGGCTPLMLACASPNLKERLQIIQELLKWGANPNYHAAVYDYTTPSLAPITEYFINSSEEVSYDVIQILLRYGGLVNFKPASRILRMRDPYGILQYASNLKGKPDLLELLLSAVTTFDAAAISRAKGFVGEIREQLLEIASTPRPLKHLIRLNLRAMLMPRLPDKIELLPLPKILKSYMLFDVL